MAGDQLHAFVEIPKGSRNKYEYDAEIGHVVLDRTLWTSVVYPADYGYLMGTMGRDGDPVDAMILVAEPTFPGCVIPVEPIGVFEMRDEAGDDDKVLCVPVRDPTQVAGGGADVFERDHGSANRTVSPPPRARTRLRA